MDILDIDEMLKDDSFHFLEENNPDDVKNIIQQWKNQNCMEQQQHDLQQQHNETYKLDSRTFTRPKRRSAAQKLETQFQKFVNGTENQQQQQQIQVPQQISPQPTTPVLNVQIGGQIRHTPLSARSMLQDTSPPSSICSMDTSLDNSLITSADFAHLNFLISTPSLESNDTFNEQTCAGYTISDMIRDRKALESLTLSADDGTLIKDSQISQIDDISLSLLKGSSGCNSMDNSAESGEENHFGLFANINNCTVQMLPNSESHSYKNRTLTGNGVDSSGHEALHRTTVINTNNGVSNTTFTCLENGQSFIISRQPDIKNNIGTEDLGHCADKTSHSTTQDQKVNNAVALLTEEGTENIDTTKNRAPALNETVCIHKEDAPKVIPSNAPVVPQVGNETYDCQQLQDDLHSLQHTPENSAKDHKTEKMYESTPCATSRIRYGGNKSSYTPAIRKIIEDPNISPIIAMDLNHQQQVSSPKKAQPGSNYCVSPLSRFTDMELLENIENPNKTYNRRSRLRQQELDDEQEQRHRNTIELQDIMDLAQAEAEMLDTENDGNDDVQQFEHMLDELSRIKLNPEQLKMQKSLEKIKKRFNCTLNLGDQDSKSHACTSTSSSEYGSGISNTFTSETRQETLRKLRDTLRQDTTSEMSGTPSNPTDLALSSNGSAVGSASGSGSSFIVSSMATSGSSSGERLLNRRSRLNDDINLSSIKQLSQCASGTDTSFTVPSKSVGKENININIDNFVAQQEVAEKTAAQSNAISVKTDEGGDKSKYKLAEQRERDRDRFKTIKIVRNKNEDLENDTQAKLNVPCIDDDHDDLVPAPLECEENTETVQHLANENNNRKDAKEMPKTTTRFSRSDLENSQNKSNSKATATTISSLRQPEARSLSRPRYISGLQKFSVVSKAVSAGDLELNDNNVPVAETKTSQLTRMYEAKRSYLPGEPSNSIAKPTNKLKSPMGVKAKSLHNLAYNNQGTATVAGTAAQSRIGTFGLRKISSGGFGFEQQRMQLQPQQQTSQLKQKAPDNFKKPQSVSALQSNFTREKSSNATNRSIAGIARPSSGYYSLNVASKTDVFPVASIQVPDAMKPSLSKAGNISSTVGDEPKLSKVASSMGIPKPSGIRPPNKRSGLPRPSSMIKR